MDAAIREARLAIWDSFGFGLTEGIKKGLSYERPGAVEAATDPAFRRISGAFVKRRCSTDTVMHVGPHLSSLPLGTKHTDLRFLLSTTNRYVTRLSYHIWD
ncbi:hypothetical protein MCP1_180044 [Candidatus Terasakiella magnetica]|nr:hypothetical protein MCP1_180044 [Candidatus Terasakiella magnetica]